MEHRQMDRLLKLLTWPAALVIASVLLWYEQYKLTGNPGSVFLFTVLSDWLFVHGYEKPLPHGGHRRDCCIGPGAGSLYASLWCSACSVHHFRRDLLPHGKPA